jgi:hypothetical protein
MYVTSSPASDITPSPAKRHHSITSDSDITIIAEYR